MSYIQEFDGNVKVNGTMEVAAQNGNENYSFYGTHGKIYNADDIELPAGKTLKIGGTGLATVARSGNYNDLSNRAFQLLYDGTSTITGQNFQDIFTSPINLLGKYLLIQTLSAMAIVRLPPTDSDGVGNWGTGFAQLIVVDAGDGTFVRVDDRYRVKKDSSGLILQGYSHQQTSPIISPSFVQVDGTLQIRKVWLINI